MSERPKESCQATSKTARYIRGRSIRRSCVTVRCTFYLSCHFLREKMAQAYDFALDKIGMEIMSYQVHTHTHSRGKHTVCLILSWLLSSHIYSLFPPDLGGLHQFSQRSVGVIFVFLATLHRATEPNDWSCHVLISSVRLLARMPRTSGSQRCGGSTREAVSTPWSTLSSSGEIIANMRRRVSHRGIYFWLFTYR